jgi:hypothetical protein
MSDEVYKTIQDIQKEFFETLDDYNLNLDKLVE